MVSVRDKGSLNLDGWRKVETFEAIDKSFPGLES